MSENGRLKVRLRDGFADRMGISKESTEIQLNELDDRTRTALINLISWLWGSIRISLTPNQVNQILIGILSDVYIQQVNYSGFYDHEYVFRILFDTIENDEHDSVLTVVEYIARQFKKVSNSQGKRVFDYFNGVFEKEFVGYRFVNGMITPISDSIEMEALNEAIYSSDDSVRNHLTKAMEMLSDRTNPDYENSIKESISAVECICSQIIGKATSLGDALGKLEKAGVVIHTSLKSAFDKLYGYTSDSAGVRHSGKIGGPKSTFSEAKFMLVSCCAFVNYLTEVMSKTT